MEERQAQTPMRNLPKPNNIFAIDLNTDKDFFKWWCIFLRPFVHLSNREIDVAAGFLKYRWLLTQQFKDPVVVDTMLMSDAVKKKITEECNITLQHLYVVMNNLRKHNVIVNNNINPRLIPNVRQDDRGNFQLLILFKGMDMSINYDLS